MKRVFSKRIILLSALVALAALFSYSCYQPPIFAAIEDEVKLKIPTLVGTIQDIAISGSTVYVANGNLTKKTGTGSWQQMSIPKDLCTGIAASDDTTNFYLYGIFSDSFDSQTKIYYRLNNGSWQAVPGTEGFTKVLTGADGNVFAFEQDGDTFTGYSILGSTITPLTTVSHSAPVGSAIGTDPYFATTKGVYTETGALVTGSPSEVRAIAGNGTNIYVFTDTNMYSYIGTTWSSRSHSFNSPRSAKFLDLGTTDLILVGTSAGYKEIRINGDGTLGDSQDPGSSTISSIKTSSASQYASSLKQWPVIEVCVAPASGSNAYILYAGVFETRYGGLWAYYPSTRPEWNRE